MNTHEFVDSQHDRFKDELYSFVRIPSISTDPAYAEEVKHGAQWVADDMRKIGLETVEIWETAGHPAVYGEWMGAGEGAPTLLIYGHYDVQPAAMADGWKSEPFEPEERDGYFYGRGISDDKGQVLIHLKAVEAYLRDGGKAPINFKFLIEGEEESGSVHLGGLIRDNLERLKADVCVISDTGMPAPDQPSITYALRGNVVMEVTVYGPAQDVHSGSFGGALHNPNQALAEIIAGLHNPDGSVAVEGFYDDVLPLSKEEQAELNQTAWDEAEWKTTTGAPQPWGEAQYPIHERTGARPTLEITGMAGGYFETGFKNVIPSKAWAKISCRTVANQTPQKIGQLVSDYIQKITPPTVRSEVRVARGGYPAFVDIRTPAMQAAVRAYEKGWGKKPVFMREGGSIPVVSDFQKQLGLPVILMGFTLSSDGAHGPNEFFKADMFYKGIHTTLYFYEEIGKELSK